MNAAFVGIQERALEVYSEDTGDHARKRLPDGVDSRLHGRKIGADQSRQETGRAMAPPPRQGSGLPVPVAPRESLLRRQAQAGKQQLEGKLDVTFNNAPPGTRVNPRGASQPGLRVNTDVGYNRFATR